MVSPSATGQTLWEMTGCLSLHYTQLGPGRSGHLTRFCRVDEECRPPEWHTPHPASPHPTRRGNTDQVTKDQGDTEDHEAGRSLFASLASGSILCWFVTSPSLPPGETLTLGLEIGDQTARGNSAPMGSGSWWHHIGREGGAGDSCSCEANGVQQLRHSPHGHDCKGRDTSGLAAGDRLPRPPWHLPGGLRWGVLFTILRPQGQRPGKAVGMDTTGWTPTPTPHHPPRTWNPGLLMTLLACDPGGFSSPPWALVRPLWNKVEASRGLQMPSFGGKLVSFMQAQAHSMGTELLFWKGAGWKLLTSALRPPVSIPPGSLQLQMVQA